MFSVGLVVAAPLACPPVPAGAELLLLCLCSRIAAILLPLDLPCTSMFGQSCSLLIWLRMGNCVLI